VNLGTVFADLVELGDLRAPVTDPTNAAERSYSAWAAFWCLCAKRRFNSVTAYHLAQFAARKTRLVAAALSARDPAAVVPFNRGSLHAAALSWADGDTASTDANSGVGIVPPTFPIVAGVAVVEVPPGLHIDLGHLDALGLGRSDERGSRQHHCGCRHGKSDLHHVGVLLGLDLEAQRAGKLRVPHLGQSRGRTGA
jgi:hypothetical protein